VMWSRDQFVRSSRRARYMNVGIWLFPGIWARPNLVLKLHSSFDRPFIIGRRWPISSLLPSRTIFRVALKIECCRSVSWLLLSRVRYRSNTIEWLWNFERRRRREVPASKSYSGWGCIPRIIYRDS
jgi:hypothetical protein